MRAYTLAVLRDLQNTGKPIVDQDIINWANGKLDSAGKSSRVDSFKDPKLSDGKVVIDLIDSIVPGSVRYELVRDADNDEVLIITHSVTSHSITSHSITSHSITSHSITSHSITSHSVTCVLCYRTG